MAKIGTDACKMAVQTLLRSYFQMRDGEALKKMLLPDVTCVGVGDGAVCYGREETCRLIRSGLGLYPDKFSLLSEREECTEIASGIYSVVVNADIAPELDSGYLDRLNIRISLVVLEREEQFRIAHIHLSSSPKNLDFGEIFDKEAARANFSAFEKQIKKRTVIVDETLKDPLTGILSIDGFEKHARKIMWRNPEKQYIILHFSIDNFRVINQKYGYDAGDRILKNIAKNLSQICRPGELYARIERSEFIALLDYPGSTSEVDDRLAWFRSQLLDPGLAAQFKPDIDFIGGLYLTNPGECEEMKEILDKVAVVYKNAKENGYGDRFFYYDENSYRQLLYNQTLMRMAPEALRNGEFQLYVQPQVDLNTLAPIAGEALVRWVQPDGTIITPGDFVPLFEQNGFIVEMDLYLLEELCKRIRRCLDEGIRPLPTAINQSRRHLLSATYINDLCEIVDRYNIPHELVVFELTESAYADCGLRITELSKQLQSHGFRRAIDDFGAGYASLSLLGMISADILKVDRSLINDMGHSERCRVILKKVLEIAQSTEMQVICEGIETKEQAELLKNLNCTYGQGYYFYRPMPMDDYVESILKPLNCHQKVH